MDRLFRSYLPSEARIRSWLGDHPVFRWVLARAGFLSFHRKALGRGVAVGLFIGLTPTVGVQSLLMIVGCVLFRASFPAAFLISWISNPLTAAPLYFGFNRVGEAVFGHLLAPLLPGDGLAGQAAMQTIYMGLGSLLIAIPASLAGYGLFLGAWRYSVIRRRRRGHQ
jgi:hypothetical protein